MLGFYGENLLTPEQASNWWTIPCWPSTTCHNDRDPLIMELKGAIS